MKKEISKNIIRKILTIILYDINDFYKQRAIQSKCSCLNLVSTVSCRLIQSITFSIPPFLSSSHPKYSSIKSSYVSALQLFENSLYLLNSSSPSRLPR
jgi:hypothetical protein